MFKKLRIENKRHYFGTVKLLEVKNLSIYFNQNGRRIHAVKDLSFDVYNGEILGLVGESGSGKSVTAMSILRLLPSNGIIDSGSILWNYKGSKSLLDLKEDELRTIRLAEIAMIFQEPMTSLNPVLTCGSQVAEGYSAHIKATKHEIKAKVIDLLQSWDYQNQNECIDPIHMNYQEDSCKGY